MNDANKERDDYVKYRLQRAKETINEIELLIEGKLLNTAINRMYYTCFYAVGALLIKNGIETSSHSATRKKFGQLFVHTGLIVKILENIPPCCLREDRQGTTAIFMTLTRTRF